VNKRPVNRVKGVREDSRRRHEVVGGSPIRFDGGEGHKLVEGGTRWGSNLDAIMPYTPALTVNVEGMGKDRGEAGFTELSIRFG
jgi:hypothetical protein